MKPTPYARGAGMNILQFLQPRGRCLQQTRHLPGPQHTRPPQSTRISSRHLSTTFPHHSPTPSRSLQSSQAGAALGGSSSSRKNLDKDVTNEELSHFDATLAADKQRQIRTPWHRDGSSKPPVSRPRSAGAMTKGKLLTTPNRLLKLVLPLTTRDTNTDRKDAEPLALLVHPSQPLSYLERLIQSELPMVKDKNGRESLPDVNFLAVDAQGEEDMTSPSSRADEDADETIPDTSQRSRRLRGGPGEGGVETYSGAGRESKTSGHATASDDPSTDHDSQDAASSEPFVRWSKSTELGDFIREAARGREFAVEISSAPREIRVGVPSFNDRTYYLRTRLRKKAGQIAAMAEIKKECDLAAHRSAQRVAWGGFGGMLGWGGIVAWLTFETSLGWDVMEPITYLAGLVGILGGYGWFLFNRREASYASAMNLTVSRRQNALYESKGFDLGRWGVLVEEGNALRKEIRSVAAEYDVEWDERKDAKDEKVVEALREHRDAKRKGEEVDGEDEGEDGEEEKGR